METKQHYWIRSTLFFWLHLIDFIIVQKGVYQLPIHRSRSVPSLAKEGSLKQMDYPGSVFRVVTTTPRVTEHTAVTSMPTVTTGTGKI